VTAQRFEELERWVSGFQLSVCLSAGSLGAWAAELEGNQAGFQTCLAGNENPTWFPSILQKMSYSSKHPS